MKLRHALLPLALLGAVANAYADETSKPTGFWPGPCPVGQKLVTTRDGKKVCVSLKKYEWKDPPHERTSQGTRPIEDEHFKMERGIEKKDIRISPSVPLPE